MITEPAKPINIFLSYAHKDKALYDELTNHLEALKHSGQITLWHDRELQPGTEWKREIDKNLNASDIILLLISPNFIRSDYCYDVEMLRALDRHKAGEARVIPIILRPVDWKDTPIGELQALPVNGKPITTWRNRDEAFTDVVRGIKAVIADFTAKSSAMNKIPNTENPKLNTPYSIGKANHPQYVTEQHLYISRNLTSLADRIEKSDRRTASQLRSLSHAVNHIPAADLWTAADIHNLAVVAERFRDTPTKSIFTLESIRNLLILALPIFTWLAVSLATQDYNQFIQVHPAQTSQSFISLWQQGFGGILPFWFTFGWACFIEFFTICMIISLIYLIHNKDRKIKSNEQKLHNDITQTLSDALSYLHPKERPLPGFEDN